MSRKRKKTGLPPGSIVFTGNRQVEKIQIHHLLFNAEQLEEKVLDNQHKIVFNPSDLEMIDWYDVRGLHDTALIEALGKTFKIHPLILEDIADVNQRSKFEEYEGGNFIIIPALAFQKDAPHIHKEQVAVYFQQGLVLTFQETASDLFEAVRSRLKAGKGKIRLRGSDYLVYALMDSIVDRYYLVLDEVEEVISDLEETMLDKPGDRIRADIHRLKKELLLARRSIAQLREAILQFTKVENDHINEGTMLYTQDLHDHTVQVLEMIETYRDVLNGLLDLHLSEISFKMNKVMQVLTIITTIFVPLSFLAGLYGMNFKYMPELQYRYGYFILLGVMAVVVIGLLIWFRKRKWL